MQHPQINMTRQQRLVTLLLRIFCTGSESSNTTKPKFGSFPPLLIRSSRTVPYSVDRRGGTSFNIRVALLLVHLQGQNVLVMLYNFSYLNGVLNKGLDVCRVVCQSFTNHFLLKKRCNLTLGPFYGTKELFSNKCKNLPSVLYLGIYY